MESSLRKPNNLEIKNGIFIVRDGIEVIEAWTFAHNQGLEKVILPKSLKTIEHYAFYVCENLKKVILPEGLVYISISAFNGCKNLQKIKIPSTVRKIDHDAFRYCENLKKVILSEGLEYISVDVFSGCKNLAEIKIPNTVRYIGQQAFYNCENLKKVILPEGLERISADTFSGCKNLEEVKIPSTVKSIESRAFKNCESLKKVILPEGLECISADTFYGCKSLEEIIIPSKVRYIAPHAFKNCENLKKVTLSEDLEYISSHAFFGCENLEEIIFSDTNSLDNRINSLEVDFFQISETNRINILFGCKKLKIMPISNDSMLISNFSINNDASLEEIIFLYNEQISQNEKRTIFFMEFKIYYVDRVSFKKVSFYKKIHLDNTIIGNLYFDPNAIETTSFEITAPPNAFNSGTINESPFIFDDKPLNIKIVKIKTDGVEITLGENEGVFTGISSICNAYVLRTDSYENPYKYWKENGTVLNYNQLVAVNKKRLQDDNIYDDDLFQKILIFYVTSVEDIDLNLFYYLYVNNLQSVIKENFENDFNKEIEEFNNENLETVLSLGNSIVKYHSSSGNISISLFKRVTIEDFKNEISSGLQLGANYIPYIKPKPTKEELSTLIKNTLDKIAAEQELLHKEVEMINIILGSLEVYLEKLSTLISHIKKANVIDDNQYNKIIDRQATLISNGSTLGMKKLSIVDYIILRNKFKAKLLEARLMLEADVDIEKIEEILNKALQIGEIIIAIRSNDEKKARRIVSKLDGEDSLLELS